MPVPADRVLPHNLTFQGPQLHGAVAQLLHTAIDVGIADGALAEAVDFVRTFGSGFESGFETAAEASIAVAAAKAHAANTAVEIAGALFEVSGTRSALNSLNLHRHWRDARTRSPVARPPRLNEALRAAPPGLHDPARWKIQHIGRYVLNGTKPPRHGLL